MRQSTTTPFNEKRKQPIGFQLLLSVLLVLGFQATCSAELKDATEILRNLAPIDSTVDARRAIDLDIEFQFGSAKLSSRAHMQLDALASALMSNSLENASIGIHGHTDAVGTAKDNKSLSEARAASVAMYLITKHSIDAERLQVKGFGEEQLKNPLSPESSENRRVEFINLGPFNTVEADDTALDNNGRIQW